MSAIVGVFGIGEIQKQLGSGLIQFANQVDREIQYAGIACQKYAKQLCPVDTGRLRSSIQYKNMGFQKCIVDTDVYYAWFVEGGHHTRGKGYVAPNPFLQPGYEQAKGELMTALRAMRF